MIVVVAVGQQSARVFHRGILAASGSYRNQQCCVVRRRVEQALASLVDPEAFRITDAGLVMALPPSVA